MPEKNINTGTLSEKSITRMRNAINWMLFFAQDKTVYSKKKKRSFKFKINFITLTLSAKQQHEDTYILHHMLFPFLKWLERKWQVTAYVWRAEIQSKRLHERGERCIHFHLTTDKFVHYRQIRNKWNALQLAHGYRQENEDPNSTDVHSVRTEGKVIGYMAKYITKQIEEPELTVNCKIFGMSRNLSQMKCTFLEEEFNRWNDCISEFFTANVREKQETKHGMIYFHDLTRKSILPPEIESLFIAMYDLFSQGIVSPTRFEIEE